MSRLRNIVVLCTIAVTSLSVFAQEKGKARKAKKQPGANPAVANFFAFPSTITLTEDQKKLLEPIVKEYTPKVTELVKARDEVMTPEQRRARRDAQKSARESGLKGKELREAVDKASDLTEEQKKQLDGLEEKINKLRAEINQKKMSFLTDEQKAKMPAKKVAKAKKKRDKDSDG